jgi:IS5 family transposase
MLGPLDRQASLFSHAFFKEVTALRDEVLDGFEPLLDDRALIAIATEALSKRSQRSADFGRPSMAADRLLRCVILKHFKGWSFRQLERELRAGLVYRRFTRFYEDPVPDFSSFSRTFALFGKDGTVQLHRRVVEMAKQEGIIKGKKLRTDTTAVETNIHHPTDSSLLADGLRVLTRTLKRVSAGTYSATDGVLKIVDHGRAAKHRVLEICRAAKTLSKAGSEKIKEGYGRLMRLVRGVTRQCTQVLEDLDTGKLVAKPESFLKVVQAQAQLQHFLPLTEKVVAQTQARIFEGQTHYPDKILSLFEEHTVVIRKGKAHKPTEFGRLVRIDEVENGIVSNYHIAANNMADQQQWGPALRGHMEIFGQPPVLAAADRGLWSTANEQLAQQLGVARAVLPARGRLSKERSRRQKERWFRRGQGWRAGIEARISILKHPFNMKRAYYKGESGFERHVGCSVIAQNLVAIIRGKAAKIKKQSYAPSG